MTPTLPPPHVTLKIMDRLMARVPADCPLPFEAVATAMMAYLSGIRWDDDVGMMALIEETLTIRTDTRTFNVLSWKGALQMLSFPTEEAWVDAAGRAEEAALEGVAFGEWTPWFCVFCGRKWADGSEPDACPDCDHPLTRFKKEDRDA